MKLKLSAVCAEMKRAFDDADRDKNDDRWARVTGDLEFNLRSLIFDSIDHIKALEDAAEFMRRVSARKEPLSDFEREAALGVIGRLRDVAPTSAAERRI